MQQVLNAITKKFGNVVRRASVVPPIQRIQTGVFALDLATGGGLPVDRLSLLWGKHSSGKSDLALRVVSEFQKLCHTCYRPVGCQCEAPSQKQAIWVDTEGAFSLDSPAGRFVDSERLYHTDPTLGSEAVDIADAFAKTPEVGLIIFDSLAGLISGKEYEGTAEDNYYALQSKLVSLLLHKLVASIATRKHNGDHLTVVLINQARANQAMHGSPDKPAGGYIVPHLASVTIRFWQKPLIEDKKISDKPLFYHTAFSVQKNKVCLGISDGEYRVSQQDCSGVPAGLPDDYDILSAYSRRYGVIVKDGGWKFDGHVWKNLEQLDQAIRSDADLFQKLREQTLQRSITGVYSKEG